jgi:hypothetical protein
MHTPELTFTADTRSKQMTTTTLIVDADYFVANLDNGGIRVGLKNVGAIDVPAGHALYAVAAEIKTEEAAESFFDERFVSAWEIA